MGACVGMRRLLSGLVLLPLALALAPSPADAARTARLPTFDTCSELVQFARRGMTRPETPPRAITGFGGAVSPRKPEPQPAPPAPGDPLAPPPLPSIAADSVAENRADSAAPVAGEDFSTTNVQELGIDEPDLVKTDGRRMFVVAGTELWAFDVAEGAPKFVSKLSLEGAGGELLLRGDRLLLIGPAPSAAAARSQVVAPPVPVPPPPTDAPRSSDLWPAAPAPITRLAEIDISDPAAMRIARTMLVPGERVSARLTGGTIRVVLSSPATLPAATPASTASVAPRKRPGVRAFIPRTTLRSRVTGRTFRRDLVPCDHVRHPRAFAGLDLLTVLSVDFDRGLFNVDRDAVMAGAQVVYASATGLYVASTRSADIDRPSDVPRGMTTEIHRFDTSKAGETTYASTGSVPGFVLNQYALSEHEGDLRVASTTSPLWLPGAPEVPSESAVTVLREQGSRLAQIGQVTGLGKTERIYASRFIGPVAYIVTFRRIDPLYTVDLRDPTAPKVAGELKIPGYSAYLHPLGDGLLLGVGQDGGAQVSLFDVSNPASPTRLAVHALGGGTLNAEFDPHAFLWWARSDLALLPFSGWNSAERRSEQAAIGLRATRAGGLAEAGRVSHGPAWDQAAVARSLVVGDRIVTISDFGVSTHTLAGFTPVGFVPFVPTS